MFENLINIDNLINNIKFIFEIGNLPIVKSYCIITTCILAYFDIRKKKQKEYEEQCLEKEKEEPVPAIRNKRPYISDESKDESFDFLYDNNQNSMDTLKELSNYIPEPKQYGYYNMPYNASGGGECTNRQGIYRCNKNGFYRAPNGTLYDMDDPFQRYAAKQWILKEKENENG